MGEHFYGENWWLKSVKLPIRGTESIALIMGLVDEEMELELEVVVFDELLLLTVEKVMD